jgi:FHS family L-fucose permease-like MFS transporter
MEQFLQNMITPVQSSSSGTKGGSLFRTASGNNYAFLFLLVTSLFLLWGVCNGMIDILNKHFQDSLHISKMQSAFVQFANYMGYFFMAIPSGILARRFGYKGAIIIGLALVATGAFWFIPATHIGTYWAFLLGLFILAAGLTCLETVANPYTTVLGPKETSAVRINLAQSGNGVGWMIGPVLGGFFVLSATGEANTSNADLYKPYLIVGLVVSLLTLVFVFAKVPDLKAEEECKVEGGPAKAAVKPLFKRWHFILAVVAQFFYVAAQTGIFSFFINYMASDAPTLGQNSASKLQNIVGALPLPTKVNMTYSAAMFSAGDITNLSAFAARLQNDPDTKTRPVSEFIWSQFSTNTTALLTGAPADTDPKELLKHQTEGVAKELNRIVQTNALFDTARFAGVAVPEDIRQTIAQNPGGEKLVRLNRSLLEATYSSDSIARSSFLQSARFLITDQGAGRLLSFGAFGLFLLGRFTGSYALRIFKAQSMLALYSIANVLMMVLVMFPLGWLSVAGLFLSFFFMSITYPTIFALGIHGLGEQTKKAASFIVMAIVGGAIMPLFMGWLADKWGMPVGFLMPLICFVIIAAYGAVWQKLEAKDSAA